MKRFGAGDTPFYVGDGKSDIPDNDPQELIGATNQQANNWYAEQKNLIEGSGQTLTTNTNDDLYQAAKAALIFGGKATYFTADSSTANNKILKAYNTGFVLPTLDLLDGFEFEFINKTTNTGDVTVLIDGVGQTSALPLKTVSGLQVAAGALIDGIRYSIRYIKPISAFVLSQVIPTLGAAAYKDIGTGADQIPDMSSFESELSTNGYQKLPGGLILQWTSVSSAGGTTPSGAVANFPIPWPTTMIKAASVDGGGSCLRGGITAISKTQFRWWAQDYTGNFQPGGQQIIFIGR